MAKIYVKLKKAVIDKDWSEGRTYRVLDVDNVRERFLLMDDGSGAIQYFNIVDCLLGGYEDRGSDIVWVKIRDGVTLGNFQTGRPYLVLSIDNAGDRFLLAEPGSGEIRYFLIAELRHGGGNVVAGGKVMS